MRSFRSSLAAVLALLLAACGARTTLRDYEGASGPSGVTSGAGGSGAGGSGAGGNGAGGSGGAPLGPQCPALVAAGAPITFDAPSPAHHQDLPTLLPLDAAGVAVVFAHNPVEAPADVLVEIRHASFAPWGLWPTSLGVAITTAEIGGQVYTAAPTDATGFALELQNVGSGGKLEYGSVSFAPLALAGKSYSPAPPSFPISGFVGSYAAFAARVHGGHLVGHQALSGTPYELILSLTDSGGVKQVWSEAACATDRMLADAVGLGLGGLVAFDSGRPFGLCMGDGLPGPPTELQIGSFTPGQPLVHGTTVKLTDPLRSLHLTERSDGAWVVWQENGASAFTPPPIQAMRVDVNGAPASSPIAVNGGGTIGPTAATRLGDGVAVAWIDSTEPSAPTLLFQVIEASGELGAAASLPTLEAWQTGDRISLLGSADGRSLLLAWSGMPDPGGDALRRVYVARFDCVNHD